MNQMSVMLCFKCKKKKKREKETSSSQRVMQKPEENESRKELRILNFTEVIIF